MHVSRLRQRLFKDGGDGFGSFADDFFGFLTGQAERRCKAEDVALWHGSGDHAVLHQRCGNAWSYFVGGIEEYRFVLVNDELDSGQQSFTADIANMGMASERVLEGAIEIRAGLA